MPFGDSITASCCVPREKGGPQNKCCVSKDDKSCCKKSYRHFLHEKLMATPFGASVDFVGGERGLVNDIVKRDGGFVAGGMSPVRGSPSTKTTKAIGGGALGR